MMGKVVMQKAKLQHYVPQFYLRRFAKQRKEEYFVYCYAKNDSKIFFTNIRNIGGESYFYDLEGDDLQIIEKMLANIEGKFNYVTRKIIRKKDLNIISLNERAILALLIVLQELRTREQRERIKSIPEKILTHFDEYNLSPTDELKKQIEESLTEESLKRTQIKLMLEGLPELTSMVLNLKWIILENKTKMNFWASDHPICRYNSIDMSPYGNLGYLSPGIEIYLPLNPKITLLVCDPMQFPHYGNYVEINDTKNIVFQNCLQIREANQHLFSFEKDFELAEEYLNENPELRQTTRKRFTYARMD